VSLVVKLSFSAPRLDSRNDYADASTAPENEGDLAPCAQCFRVPAHRREHQVLASLDAADLALIRLQELGHLDLGLSETEAKGAQ
jgi:hypothetical protein